MRFPGIGLLICILWFSFPAFPQRKGNEIVSSPESKVVNDVTSIFDLVDIVAAEDSEENEDEDDGYYPSELADIVSSYYAEATVDESVANEVLSYLTEVYSVHGYHDTGNWAPPLKKSSIRGRYSRYVPYQGELPEFEDSDFISPVEGSLTSRFGYRHRFRRFHHGVDIALNIGDTVRCVLPGVVTKSGYEPSGYGRYVIVVHNGGLETLYGHLQREIAKPGEKVNAGAPLGLGGATGNATGPHLHFETRYQGVPMDPMPWLTH